jgi:hypothetical protein
LSGPASVACGPSKPPAPAAQRRAVRYRMVEESQRLPPDEVRDAAEIARRALALFGFVGLALGAPREDIVAWLQRERLWADLSPSELAYVSAAQPTKRQEIYASWNSERLVVLLWALGKVENLPAPNEQCDTALFQQHMPHSSTSLHRRSFRLPRGGRRTFSEAWPMSC